MNKYGRNMKKIKKKRNRNRELPRVVFAERLLEEGSLDQMADILKIKT